MGVEKRMADVSLTEKARAFAEGSLNASSGLPRIGTTRFGADASLDDIAKQAGMGAGVLYRHFPTRDALIEAVYRCKLEKLAVAERKFTETMPPTEALRIWMLLFVDHIAAKQIIAPH